MQQSLLEERNSFLKC